MKRVSQFELPFFHSEVLAYATLSTLLRLSWFVAVVLEREWAITIRHLIPNL